MLHLLTNRGLWTSHFSAVGSVFNLGVYNEIRIYLLFSEQGKQQTQELFASPVLAVT